MTKSITVTIENITEEQYIEIWEGCQKLTKKMFKFDLPQQDALIFDAQECLDINKPIFLGLISSIMSVHNMVEHSKRKNASVPAE